MDTGRTGGEADLGSIGEPAHPVAGAVHAPAGWAERVGQKTLGGGAGPAQIAARQPLSSKIKLARHPDGHGLKTIVEHIGAALAHGAADGGIGPVEALGGRHPPGHGRDHRFGGTVAVDERLRAQRPLHRLEAGAGHGLATEGIDLHRRRIPRALHPFGELGEIGGREAGVGDAMAG